MGKYKQAVITNNGQSLIAQATAGSGTIMYTFVKTSSYAYPSGTNIAGLTDLQDIVQSVKPSAAGVFNNTMIQVSATFNSTGVEADYLIQTIGVYAKLDDGDEVLFAVIQANTPDQMPEESEISPTSIIYNIQITVQQAASISVTVDPSGTASVQDISNLQNQINVIQQEIGQLENVMTITLPASGWSSSFPYTQTVSVQGFEDNDRPVLSMAIEQTSTADEIKAYKKAYGYIYYGSVSSNAVTIYATNKPTIDIKVTLSGYMGSGTILYSNVGDVDLTNYVQVEQTGG